MGMKTNGRAIEVTTKTRQELAKVFSCTERMVWKALTWDSDTPLARKIRVAAIEKGGRVMNWVPECETIHCTADGTMHQTFGNGAVIVADFGQRTVKVTDRYGVMQKGVSVNISLQEFANLQVWAASL